MKQHLVIFARLPRLGMGKRRLAVDVGPLRALNFQKNTLARLLRRLGKDPRWKTWVALTPSIGGFPRLYGVHVILQPRGDLGQRMGRVAKSMSTGPVLIIGSDIPDIDTKHIQAGFKALRSHDAVLGPAGDGGYWAVGLRRRPHFFTPFDRVRWSTEYAFEDTVRNLDKRKVARLETLDDVDTAVDLQRRARRKTR